MKSAVVYSTPASPRQADRATAWGPVGHHGSVRRISVSKRLNEAKEVN